LHNKKIEVVEIIQGNILSLNLQGLWRGYFAWAIVLVILIMQEMKHLYKKVSNVFKTWARWIINTGVLAESFLTKFVTEKNKDLRDFNYGVLSNTYDVWEQLPAYHFEIYKER